MTKTLEEEDSLGKSEVKKPTYQASQNLVVFNCV